MKYSICGSDLQYLVYFFFCLALHFLFQTLYRSLMELLEYDGDDMEDVFMQSFRVGYQDVFGTSLTHDLKPGGDNVLVSQSNKKVG